MNRTALTLACLVPTLAALTACGELEGGPQDRMGNYEVEYTDGMRVYINDELVAELTDADSESFEWNGEIIEIGTLCSDEGVQCPSESFWGTVAVDQPWGADYDLLNFVNLDPELGTPGQRMGGTLYGDGSFVMLSGLGLATNENCAVLGVGTVEGTFDATNSIQDGVIAYEWGAGCGVGEVVITGSLRLETDYTATRVGDYDVSSVTPEEPIDEEGAQVDPEQPEDDHSVAE